MRRVLVAGFVLAVLAALALWVGNQFSIALGSTIFGVALGAVLALVPNLSPGKKIGGYLIGLVITFVMFAVQALFLPLASIGSIVGAFITVLVITIVAALLHSKIPFWTFLLGVAALGGAYGTQFLAAPQNFATEGIAAFGSILFISALGFLGAVIAELIPSSDENEAALEQSASSKATSSSDSTPEGNAGADILTSTKG